MTELSPLVWCHESTDSPKVLVSWTARPDLSGLMVDVRLPHQVGGDTLDTVVSAVVQFLLQEKGRLEVQASEPLFHGTTRSGLAALLRSWRPPEVEGEAEFFHWAFKQKRFLEQISKMWTSDAEALLRALRLEEPPQKTEDIASWARRATVLAVAASAVVPCMENEGVPSIAAWTQGEQRCLVLAMSDTGCGPDWGCMVHIVGSESTQLEFLIFLGLLNAGYVSVRARRLQDDGQGWRRADNFAHWSDMLPSHNPPKIVHFVLLSETENVAGALWRLHWEVFRQGYVREPVEWNEAFSWPDPNKMGLAPEIPVLLGSLATAWKLRAPLEDESLFILGGDKHPGLFVGEDGAPLDDKNWPELDRPDMFLVLSISALSGPWQESSGPSQAQEVQTGGLPLDILVPVLASPMEFQDGGHLLLFVEDAARLRHAMRILAVFLFCRGDTKQRTLVTMICPEALHLGKVVSQLAELRKQVRLPTAPLEFIPLDLDLVSGWPLERLSSMDFFLFKDRPVDLLWVDAPSPQPLLAWFFLRSRWLRYTHKPLRLIHHPGDVLGGAAAADEWTVPTSLFVVSDEEPGTTAMWNGWRNTRVWNLSQGLQTAIMDSAMSLSNGGQVVMIVGDERRLQRGMHDLSVLLCYRERGGLNTFVTLICPDVLDDSMIHRQLKAIRRYIWDMLGVPHREGNFDLRIATGVPLEQLDSNNLQLIEGKPVDLLWVDADRPEPALRLLLEHSGVKKNNPLRLVHHQDEEGSTTSEALQGLQHVQAANEEVDLTEEWAGLRSTTVWEISHDAWMEDIWALDPDVPDKK